MINKDKLRDYISDCFSDFCYYDRKEDDEFTRDDVARLKEYIEPEEIAQMFYDEDLKAFSDD